MAAEGRLQTKLVQICRNGLEYVVQDIGCVNNVTAVQI
jgi:hypothetical protein